MPPHQSYNVRHRLVRFDSQRLQHKNAPHTGTRYAIVMFNKDLNYAGSTEDVRSNLIKAQPPVRLSVVPTSPADQAAFLEVLDATRFPQDRSTSGKPHSKYGETRGTFLSFGETQSRKSRADRHCEGLETRRSDNQNNTKYATLYQAFLTYMEVFAPGVFGGAYTSCIIAKNSQCEWHRDTGNIGHASITALGPYEGGELLVESEKEIRTATPVAAGAGVAARTVEKWGYKNQVWKVPTLAVTVRPDTTDDKVIAEVLTGNAYQNRAARFTIDADDKWLDLGGNIGTFALLALAAGGTVVSVEPEPENAALLRTNLAANFETGWSVRECGVAPEPGTMDLQLCNGPRNKYRHSMFAIQYWNAKHKAWKAPTKPRETVAVPVESLASMLNGINAVKMDIEGMEIQLLESLTDEMCTGLQKLVFEYTWDVDPSVPRFLAVVKHLRQWFTVHYTGVNADEPEYRHYPAATMVYCVRRPDDYIIAIPSYHRLKCFQTRTYKRVIQKHGLNHKVHLYLQNPEDVAEYGAAFPDLTIHESPPGLLATMNHIGHAWPIGKRVVVMHDDLTCVHGLDADGKRADVDDLDALFTSTFARLDALNLHLAGFYPHSNPLSMIKAPEQTTDLRFIHDPLHLVRNQRVPLSLGPKQDFERTIEYYKRDGGVLRLNRFAFRTAYNPKTSGGYGHRTPEDEAAATQLFLSVYSEYVKRVITRTSGNTSVVFRRVS